MCEAAGVAGREPIRGALEAHPHFQPLPQTLTSTDEALALLRNHLARPGRPAAHWSASGPVPMEQAVRAVFAAADPDVVTNLMPLLDLAKAATDMSGEDLIREVCAERGYG